MASVFRKFKFFEFTRRLTTHLSRWKLCFVRLESLGHSKIRSDSFMLRSTLSTLLSLIPDRYFENSTFLPWSVSGMFGAGGATEFGQEMSTKDGPQMPTIVLDSWALAENGVNGGRCQVGLEVIVERRRVSEEWLRRSSSNNINNNSRPSRRPSRRGRNR